jgi:sensor c-di-GMP phosphodiesterase-like protein
LRQTRYRWALYVAGGLLLAAAPYAVFDQALKLHIERQARGKLEAVAASTLGMIENRLDQAATTLVDLAAANVDSCNDAALAAMRRAVFTSVPLKELSLVGGDGRTICTHIGAEPEERTLSREINLSSRITISVARFRDRSERAVQLRLDRVGKPSLAALIPSDTLLPEASPDETNGGRRIRVVLEGGNMIASRPVSEEGASFEGGSIAVQRRSERFPILVDAERGRATIAGEYRDLLLMGRLAAILITALGLGLAWLWIERDHNDPVAELKQAIANGEIVPFYQPLIDLRTGRIHGAEVLARWRRPDGTLVPPIRFIPIAEDSGLIYELTRVLMRRARDEMAGLYGERPNVKLGFNLFAGHFVDGKIVEDVKEIFGGSPIAFSQIVLEVTERSPLADLAEARHIIAQLQELGAKVGIDDVGTGHGGLSYLLKLGVDLIKIDKMFVDALGTERYSQTIIETLVELARNMKMEVVAEGVETFEQVEYLRVKGITVAQGYIFAPPLPGGSYSALIEAAERPQPKARDESVLFSHAG